MDRIELNEQFFEDEVREGFYVPAAIKQAWGAQIQVLNEVDRICSKLGVRYFASWGTFLGAVRHSGYIPWDDDLDICMLRDDYNRFLEEGVPMLSEGYEIYNLETKEDRKFFVANVVARSRICFEPDHLEKFHGFPYIAGIDIFVDDYMSNDTNEQELMKLKAKYLLKTSDDVSMGSLIGKERKERFKYIEDNFGIKIPDGLSDNKTRQFIDIKVEELFASFLDRKDTAERIIQMMPCGVWDWDFYIQPSYYYKKQIDIPFETGTIPVPLYYEPAVQKHYKGYMELHKIRGGHDYPFFEKSKAQLREVLDFDIPEYSVSAEAVLRQVEERAGHTADEKTDTYKAVTGECFTEMHRLIVILEKTVDQGEVIEICGQLQQLAIDLGTYMETIKGQGYDIVTLLEKYCESLYELTVAESVQKRSELFETVSSLFSEAVEKTRSRKEVLFLPFKGEYWNAFEHEYRKAVEDPETDVYVVPIPYYYKDYLGRLKDMQFYPGRFPKDIVLTGYDSYDYAIRHPDIIYIQNPYDAENAITSVPPFFYSDKLLEYTDMLVYIPWFSTHDFVKEDDRDYANMKYYCTVPGVVNADRVILQSETLRNTYIEKLCEFAGEETREVWEKKITVSDRIGDKKDNNEEGIKTLLYYPDFSDVLLYGRKAVDKIKAVADICKKTGVSWKFILLKGRLIESELKDYDPGLYDDYMDAVMYAQSEAAFEVVNEEDTDHQVLADRYSAYYGDGGHVAHVFRNVGKPVKLQSYEETDLEYIDRIYETADFWLGGNI